jgi:hypothetical protein
VGRCREILFTPVLKWKEMRPGETLSGMEEKG